MIKAEEFRFSSDTGPVLSHIEKTLSTDAAGQPVYLYRDLLKGQTVAEVSITGAPETLPTETGKEAGVTPPAPNTDAPQPDTSIGQLDRAVDGRKELASDLPIDSNQRGTTVTYDDGSTLTVNPDGSVTSTASPDGNTLGTAAGNPAFTSAVSSSVSTNPDGSRNLTYGYANGVVLTGVVSEDGSTKTFTAQLPGESFSRSVWTDGSGNPITSGDGSVVTGGAIPGTDTSYDSGAYNHPTNSTPDSNPAAGSTDTGNSSNSSNRPSTPSSDSDSGGSNYSNEGRNYSSSSSDSDPVVIDMDGDGVELIARSASNVFFDSLGDGYLHHTGWVGKDDALLAEDLNGDGQISLGSEIAFAARTSEADTDLQALMKLHDTNGDGVVNAADAGFEKLLLWKDGNSNGVTDAGELQTLAQAGLVSISGQRRIVNYSGGDAEISAMSTANFVQNGQTVSRAVADVTFKVETDGYKVLGVNADGTTRVGTLDGQTLVQAQADKAMNLTLDSNTQGAIGSRLGDTIIAKTASWLSGGAGDDTLMGSAQDDWLQGGSGKDILVGGDGNDTLVIDAQDLPAFVQGGKGFDIVVVEGAAGVKMDLALSTVEAAFGGSGADTFSTSGPGSIVVDGREGDDTLSGGASADRLYGGAGSDNLSGGAGNDLLDGGMGADSMDGGVGDDVYVVDSTGDVITEAADQGVDTVQSSLLNAVLGANLENLQLTANAKADGLGNALNNVMVGNAFDNTLDGGEGNDTLTGGRGNDNLIGGSGNDTYVYALGDGHDTLRKGTGNSGVDTIQLGAGIYGSDITTVRSGEDLLIGIQAGKGSLTVTDFFLSDGEGRNRVQYLRFDNGATWNLDAEYVAYGVSLGSASPWSGGGNQVGTPLVTTALGTDFLTTSTAPDPEAVKRALRQYFDQVHTNPDTGATTFARVFEGSEDTQFRIKAADLLAGLTGATLMSVQDAAGGHLSRDTQGDVLFDPAANAHGTGYFSYTVQDSAGRQSTGMVWLNVASVNDAPVANSDNFTTLEDSTLSLAISQLLANDTDADMATDSNERLEVVQVGKAQHGSVQWVNGRVVFTADADFQGQASFEYSVADAAGAVSTAVAHVNVIGVNDAPITSGQSAKIYARPDALLRIEAATLLGYVKDADLIYGDTLKLAKVVSIGSGNAWQQKDGSVLFKAGSLGDTVLTLQIVDSQGASVQVPVTINVSAGNSAASALLPGPDQASEDTSIRIASTLTIVNVVSTQHGNTAMDANGTLVFTPDTNYNGSAQVIYTVRNTDGSTQQNTLDFTVAAINDAPVVVKQLPAQAMEEDGTLTVLAATLLASVDDVDIRTNGQRIRLSGVSDASTGTVALNSVGNVVFTPGKDFNGVATFRYWVTDDAGASVGAWGSVNVSAVNDAPVPLAQKYELLEDETRTFSTQALIANAALVDVDTKTNGDVLRILSVSMANGYENKGTVTLDTVGNVVFKPKADYNGVVQFNYTVADSAGATGSNTVTLNLAAINDAPVANALSTALTNGVEDNVKTISFSELIRNFTDVDGDALTVKSVTGANGGQVSIQNGQVVFTPNKDFAGNASFVYTVADTSGANASATATVAFTNVNDAPVAAYKKIDGRALEDTPLRINLSDLAQGAYDADGDKLSVTSITPVSNGTATIDWAAQQVVFQGAANFNGVARFNYTLSDPSGATSTQVVDVNVAAVNDNPTVRARTGFTVAEDGVWSSSQDPNASGWIRLSNFVASMGSTDVDGDPLTSTEFWAYNHIAATQKDGNDLLVRLEQNYSGDAGFAYRVRDNQGGFADGQVQFNVVAQNDRPWLVGLSGWPNGGAYIGGNFNARIYGADIDSPSTNLGAGIGSAPAHGDVSMSQATWTNYDEFGKVASSGTLPATWDLSYTNHYGDEYSGQAGFNVDVWDNQGGWARQYVETYHQGTRASSGGKPVAIDLNGDGIKYTDLDDSKVLFDINGDGARDLLSWTAADDGMIVFDKNGDGIIKDLDEVSFLSYLAGSMTDLEGLSGFDTDKDGRLTAKDAQWSKFGVWQDKNQDGVTDAGEFKGLDAWNIQAINLKSDQMMDQVGDVYIMGKSTFERSDGSTGEIADVAFRYLDGADTSASNKPKTFNLDVEGVIRKRLEDAHNQGTSDAELRNMLQRFIADVASAGHRTVEVQGGEAVAWNDAMYADSALSEQLLAQQAQLQAA
ncbi:tandem-95 repeat protein [Curvibacter sp. AEP1-3]|uniref:tandem-95 repeat protein n=1 Tax=Curvibacter sp. AEP1-3 TaxID=1844971 RepID=UPI0018DF1225|nr:tandem-95 repeat protein [Curvibacter sp. AEP1-3]